MKQISMLLLLLTLGETQAFSEPTTIPACVLVETTDGLKVCAYTLPKWKEVLKADAELVSKRKLLDLEKQKTTLLQMQKIDMQRQLTLCITDQKILIGRTDQLTSDKIDLDKKLQYERARFRLGSPIAWTIAAITTSLLTGFILERIFD